MINSHSSITLNAQSSIQDIENFTEALCDQLFINETYFGNILMTLSDLFSVLEQDLQSFPCKILYNTDFLTLNIVVDGIKPELLNKISQPINLDDLESDSHSNCIFVIQTLSDSMEKPGDKTLQLSFDISAIHNKIYAERASYLRAFFKKTTEIKVASNNDQN